MSRADLLAHCLAKPGAWPDEPWEGDTVVKVGDKVFAFLGGPDSRTIGLKCGRTADEASPWREAHPDDVTVSAYVGRYGWNTFRTDGGIGSDDLRALIDDSYDDVVARLPRSMRPATS